MKRGGELKRSPMPRSTPAKEAKPAKGPRLVSCKNRACRKRFAPEQPWIRFCCFDCGVAIGMDAVAKQKAKKERAERAADKVARGALKRRADYLAEAQTAFNAWVRLRDDALPCICCGKFSDSTAGIGGRWDAGHYLSRGSHPHLRFDERNVFKQRKGCNRPGGTTAASFRLGVIARIGIDAVEALESSQAPAKWSIEQLVAIKQHYAGLVRAAKKEISA